MERRNEGVDIFLGIFLLFGLHIAVAGILYIFGYIYFVFLIGLWQFIYVAPMTIFLDWRQRWGLMKGVLIGAVITLLLNGGGCYLMLQKIKL